MLSDGQSFYNPNFMVDPPPSNNLPENLSIEALLKQEAPQSLTSLLTTQFQYPRPVPNTKAQSQMNNYSDSMYRTSDTLPTLQQIFPWQFQSAEGKSEEGNFIAQLPILEMILKEPKELFPIDQNQPKGGYLKSSTKQGGISSKKQREKEKAIKLITIKQVLLQEKERDLIKQEKLQRQILLKYKINFRLSHKFTLRFKSLEMEVARDISIQQFIKDMLGRIFKPSYLSVQKQVFIEKERDLIPLIEMRQLSTTRSNFLMIRDYLEDNMVFEKPVLMKKKNKPELGISLLTYREMSQIERLSYPSELTKGKQLSYQEIKYRSVKIRTRWRYNPNLQIDLKRIKKQSLFLTSQSVITQFKEQTKNYTTIKPFKQLSSLLQLTLWTCIHHVYCGWTRGYQVQYQGYSSF